MIFFITYYICIPVQFQTRTSQMIIILIANYFIFSGTLFYQSKYFRIVGYIVCGAFILEATVDIAPENLEIIVFYVGSVSQIILIFDFKYSDFCLVCKMVCESFYKINFVEIAIAKLQIRYEYGRSSLTICMIDYCIIILQ
jgi:hypothetical protein